MSRKIFPGAVSVLRDRPLQGVEPVVLLLVAQLLEEADLQMAAKAPGRNRTDAPPAAAPGPGSPSGACRRWRPPGRGLRPPRQRCRPAAVAAATRYWRWEILGRG